MIVYESSPYPFWMHVKNAGLELISRKNNFGTTSIGWQLYEFKNPGFLILFWHFSRSVRISQTIMAKNNGKFKGCRSAGICTRKLRKILWEYFALLKTVIMFAFETKDECYLFHRRIRFLSNLLWTGARQQTTTQPKLKPQDMRKIYIHLHSTYENILNALWLHFFPNQLPGLILIPAGR